MYQLIISLISISLIVALSLVTITLLGKNFSAISSNVYKTNIKDAYTQIQSGYHLWMTNPSGKVGGANRTSTAGCGSVTYQPVLTCLVALKYINLPLNASGKYTVTVPINWSSGYWWLGSWISLGSGIELRQVELYTGYSQAGTGGHYIRASVSSTTFDSGKCDGLESYINNLGYTTYSKTSYLSGSTYYCYIDTLMSGRKGATGAFATSGI